MTDAEADALLDTLDVWDRRHSPMAPQQRCTTDTFDGTHCVDDYWTLGQGRRWWLG